jgi:hypothetical protein
MALHHENRGNRRVEFFHIPMGECEIRPVWVFSSGRSETAICGVVINMSKGGVQVLTEAQYPMLASRYKISFIRDDQAANLALDDCYLQRIWTEAHSSLHTLSGFSFVGEIPETVAALLQSQDNQVRPFLRCEIDAVEVDHRRQ